MRFSDPDPKKNVSHELLELIIHSNAYDHAKKFINIDKIWETPDTNEQFCDNLAVAIGESIEISNVNSIISMENIQYPFGPIPIVSVLCQKYKKPLGIWKENDEPITGNHQLYGEKQTENVLVLYDVTRHGLTALRMLFYLNEIGINPNWFITIVDCNKGAEQTIISEVKEHLNYHLDFISILTLDHITSYYIDAIGEK